MTVSFKTALCTLALAATLPLAAAAQVYEAPNKLKVVPLKGGAFEVIEARGEGARGMWCAAASYVIDRSVPTPDNRLYIKSARSAAVTTPNSKGVIFTTDNRALDAAPNQALSVSVKQAGRSLPLYHAVQFCRDNIIEPEDILFLRKGDL
jgi:hypothetical protein